MDIESSVFFYYYYFYFYKLHISHNTNSTVKKRLCYGYINTSMYITYLHQTLLTYSKKAEKNKIITSDNTH